MDNNTFDAMLRERARTEDCPLPEGFDAWLDETISHLHGKSPHRKTARRTLILAAALAAVLAVSAAAAGLLLRQNRTYVFETVQDAQEAAAESGSNNVAVSDGEGFGSWSYAETPTLTEYIEAIMTPEPFNDDAVDARYAVGGPDDPWIRMHSEVLPAEYRYDDLPTARYIWYETADLSALNDFWDTGLDLEALETRYSPIVGRNYIALITVPGQNDAVEAVNAHAAYRGAGDSEVALSYTYAPGGFPGGDMYLVKEGPYEYYTTKDGVELMIEYYGADFTTMLFFGEDIRFDLFGTGLEPDEIHEILDSLNLSQVGALSG